MHWASGTSVPTGDFALHATINYADLTTETTSMSFQKRISIGEQFLTATIVPKQASQTWGSNYMDFLYDEKGMIYSCVYNGTQYYYVRNLQGDVVRILNTSGTIEVAYSYDAWGKCTITSGASNAIANANPIRYRGYYYDTDTGFYYLQSRYYDPAIKRFISADDTSLIGANGDFISFNLYAYCLNNPIRNIDASGEFAVSAFLGAVIGGAIGGSIISTVSYIVNCSLNDEEISAKGLANAAITGAVSGAVGAAIGTISLPSPDTTGVVKGILSVAVGAGMGIKSGLEKDGSVAERIWAGIETGFICSASTFLGSSLPVYDESFKFFGNVFTNYAGTLFVGTPAEIVAVAIPS